MHNNISEVNDEYRVLEGTLIFVVALQLFLPKTWQSKIDTDCKVEPVPVPPLITKQMPSWLAPWCINKVRKLNLCIEESTLSHNHIIAGEGWYLESIITFSFFYDHYCSLKMILWFFYPFSIPFIGLLCGCTWSAGLKNLPSQGIFTEQGWGIPILVLGYIASQAS